MTIAANSCGSVEKSIASACVFGVGVNFCVNGNFELLQAFVVSTLTLSEFRTVDPKVEGSSPFGLVVVKP